MARWRRWRISKPVPIPPSSISSSDDGNMPMSAFRWLVKCAVTAAALLLACGLATAWFGADCSSRRSRPATARSITLNRYVREPTPDVVLVGSSLAWRLKEEYFSHAARPQSRAGRRLAGDRPRHRREADEPAEDRAGRDQCSVARRWTRLIEKFSGGERRQRR